MNLNEMSDKELDELNLKLQQESQAIFDQQTALADERLRRRVNKFIPFISKIRWRVKILSNGNFYLFSNGTGKEEYADIFNDYHDYIYLYMISGYESFDDVRLGCDDFDYTIHSDNQKALLEFVKKYKIKPRLENIKEEITDLEESIYTLKNVVNYIEGNNYDDVVKTINS